MPTQSDLFGFTAEDIASPEKATTSKPPTASKGVQPCSVDDYCRNIAAQLPAALYLGTSSWSFPGWQGLVYHDAYTESRLARSGLPAYAKHPLLHTVGIDRTFYAPISEADFARYATQVPDHFRFLAKAPMAITSSYLRSEQGEFTDSPYFLDVDYAVREFIEPCLRGLGHKAGPLVFQFPPQGHRTTSDPDRFINRLYRFLIALPHDSSPLYAVEIRDPALMTHRFFMCLKTTGTHYCLASHARMPAPQTQWDAMRRVIETGPLIARWSLHSGFKYEDAKARYFPFNKLVDEDPTTRQFLVEACLQALSHHQPCFVIVNNKAEGSAPLSIQKLAAAIGALPPHSPTRDYHPAQTSQNADPIPDSANHSLDH